MKTLVAGARAPDFLLPDQQGKDQQLSQLLLRGPVVLFFLATPGSSGFTREAGHLRDLVMRFSRAGAHRVGISLDDPGRTELFAESETARTAFGDEVVEHYLNMARVEIEAFEEHDAAQTHARG